MERLQWWLLLLSAVMFSMSGCSSIAKTLSNDDWTTWMGHPTHFASGDHLAFSAKSHRTTASITEADTSTAEREAWWGRLVPEDKTKVMVASAPTSAPAAAEAREGWLSRLSPAKLWPAKKKATVVAASVRAPAAPAPAYEPAEDMDVTGRWRGRWMADGGFGLPRGSEAEVVFVQDGMRGTGRMTLANTVAALGVPEIVRYFGSVGTPVNYRISRSEVVARYDNGPAVVVRFMRVGDRLFGHVDSSPTFLLVLDRQ